MKTTQPGLLSRGSTSAEHPGLVFYRYKAGVEIWLTPERVEKKLALNAQAKAWNLKNPGRAKTARDKWLDKPGSKKKVKDAYQAWVNSPEGRESRKRVTHRYTHSPEGRFVNNMRSRIWDAIRGLLKGRTHVAPVILELIGCSIDEYRQHMESQFKDGMTWDNAGEWHTYHVMPLSMFDLTNPEQQKLAFNWRNVQVIWAKDNRSKSDYVEHNGQRVRANTLRKSNILAFKAA